MIWNSFINFSNYVWEATKRTSAELLALSYPSWVGRGQDFFAHISVYFRQELVRSSAELLTFSTPETWTLSVEISGSPDTVLCHMDQFLSLHSPSQNNQKVLMRSHERTNLMADFCKASVIVLTGLRTNLLLLRSLFTWPPLLRILPQFQSIFDWAILFWFSDWILLSRNWDKGTKSDSFPYNDII